MDSKYVVDISSFLLLESSGDSEGDYDSIVSMDCDSFALAEDDAESCFDGSSDVACIDDSVDIDDIYHRGEEDAGEHDSYVWHSFADSTGIWQEMVLLDHTKRNSIRTEQKEQVKVEEDASEGTMSEEEENRLFWDTCLAL